MKKRNKILIAVVIAALAAVALLARDTGDMSSQHGPMAFLLGQNPGMTGAAGPGAGRPMAGPFALGGRRAGFARFLLAEYLDLSDAQKDMLAGFRKEMLQKIAERQPKRRELREAIRAGDTATVNRLAEETGAVVTQMIKEGAAKAARFRATLTPEQQQKIENLRRKFEQRRAEFLERAGGDQPKPRH